MPERPGDIPIEERVNSGESELSEFYPTQNNDIPMDVALRQSKLRQSLYWDRKSPAHASTTHEYVESVGLPVYVITNVIRLNGIEWKYHTDDRTPESRRRVFTEKDQFIELDMEETLIWLNASPGSPNHEKVKSQLEEETKMENTNNQLILQHMYNRVESEKSLLPNSQNRPIKDSRGA